MFMACRVCRSCTVCAASDLRQSCMCALYKLLLAFFKQVQSLLAEMTPNSVRIDLQTTAFDAVKHVALEGATGPPTPGHEPWFGFDFVTFDLQPGLLQQWTACSASPELALPPPNTFIASDFGLVGGPRPKTEPWPCTPPCLLLDRPGLRCVLHVCCVCVARGIHAACVMCVARVLNA